MGCGGGWVGLKIPFDDNASHFRAIPKEVSKRVEWLKGEEYFVRCRIWFCVRATWKWATECTFSSLSFSVLRQR